MTLGLTGAELGIASTTLVGVVAIVANSLGRRGDRRHERYLRDVDQEAARSAELRAGRATAYVAALNEAARAERVVKHARQPELYLLPEPPPAGTFSVVHAQMWAWGSWAAVAAYEEMQGLFNRFIEEFDAAGAVREALGQDVGDATAALRAAIRADLGSDQRHVGRGA